MYIDRASGLATLSGPTMGTRFSASFPADALGGASPDEVQGALQGAVDLVDHQMSPWIAGSAVNRLNAAPVGQPVDVPKEMRSVLNAALVIGYESGGAFEAGVYSSVTHWGFGPAKAAPSGNPIPGPSRSAQGAFDICTKDQTVTKLTDVQIDLCAIAKGYGVDLMADVMESFGIGNYMVSIDGELRVAGCGIKGSSPQGWSIGLERPEPGVRQIECVLHCTDLALATSGGYRNFHLNGRDPVTHTIDPKSGAPLGAVRSSVTVAHDSCTLADAWATALMVLGPARGIELARAKGLHALFLNRQSPASPNVPERLGCGIMAALCQPATL